MRPAQLLALALIASCSSEIQQQLDPPEDMAIGAGGAGGAGGVGGAGDEAGLTQAPAAVGWVNRTDGRGCTGVLVAPRWVLCAAHCAQGATGGAFELRPIDEGPPQAIPFGAPLLHPDYDGGSDHDLALLPLTEATQTPPLTRASSADGLAADPVTWAGHGLTDDGPAEDVRTGAAAQIDQWTFTGTSTGEGVCAGDAGGPALQIRAQRVEVVGVVSRSDFDCLESSVNVRVDAHQAFIDGALAAE